MSYCRREGKDMISFVTKEDHSVPSSVTLPEPEPSPGLILPDGSINWNCPCLGGMATGPCGVEFREAFSCFHYSMEEKKGSNCYEEFNKMQSCMQKFPSLYNVGGDDDDGDFGLSEADNSLLEGKKTDSASGHMKNVDNKSSDLVEKSEVEGEKHSL